MGDIIKDESFDDISEMIETSAKTADTPSSEEMRKAMRSLAESSEEEKAGNPWIKRYNTLRVFKLDVVRDGSDEYFKALTEAILAITGGDYGCIDYKGYMLYYTDTPHVHSISVKDGHKEYSYEVGFQCDALNVFTYEEYSSEEERNAFLDPENDMFKKTLAILDKQIGYLDEGTWIKKRKKLRISEFKDYSSENLIFKRIEWDEREKDATDTLLFLMEDAHMRAKGLEYTEDDFDIFADVIRRMIFFADFGKRHSLCELQGFVWYEWKPKTKRNLYIWRCMNEYGQGDLPDRLLDNCAIYYFLDDPKGWEALAYLLPIIALSEMCKDYEPDNVRDAMLIVLYLIPGVGYRERIEKLIEEDRAKAEQGGYEDDQENNGSSM